MKNLTSTIKRKVAALLVCIMMTTQVLAAVPTEVIGDGVSNQTYDDVASDSNIEPENSEISGTEPEDTREFISLVGRIVYMGNQSWTVDDIGLQLFANEKADFSHKPVIIKGEDNRRSAEGEGGLELINDLDYAGSEETASASNTAFSVWEYHYTELPTKDDEGNTIRYELRDATYSVATASQALYYTDLEGTELVDAERSLNKAGGTRLVYVDMAEIEGNYIDETKGSAPVQLELSATSEEDLDVVASEGEAKLDTEEGIWFVSYAARYNPLTGTPITYRVAVVSDETDTIQYTNEGQYKALEDYAYDGGTIYRTDTAEKTFRAEGTITWKDGDDWNDLRPEELDFVKILDENGNDVTSLMELAVADTDSDHWSYTIDGLLTNQKYKMEQTHPSYQWEGVEEIALSYGLLNWSGVKKLSDRSMTLNTRSVSGVINWNGYNPAVQGREELDFLKVYAGSRDVTEYVMLDLSKEHADQGIWGYTVSGLATGKDYVIKADKVKGYTITPSEIAVSSAEVRTALRSGKSGILQTFDAFADRTVTLSINNKATNLVAEGFEYSYHIQMQGTGGEKIDYTGEYVVTKNGSKKEYTLKADAKGIITIPANAVLDLKFASGTDVIVTQGANEAIILYDALGVNGKTVRVNKEKTINFTNIAATLADFKKEWNDNHNEGKNRPKPTVFGTYLKLQYSTDGTNWYTLGDNKAEETKLGFDFVKIGINGNDDNASGENQWPISYEKLPATDADGTVLQYNVVETAVPHYKTTYKAGDETFKRIIVNTSYTEFEAQKKWLDNENTYKTRVDKAAWIENLELYQVAVGKADTKMEFQTGDSEAEYYLAVEPDATDEKMWNIDITILPQFDGEGLPYTYYLKEKNEKQPVKDNKWNDNTVHYKAVYDNTGQHSANTTQCYENGMMINELQGDYSFTFTKQWLDDEEVENRPALTFELMRYVIKNEGDDFQTAAPVMKLTREAKDIESEYKMIFSKLNEENLPRFDGDGREYIYFVREAGLGGAYKQMLEYPAESEALYPAGVISSFNSNNLIANKGIINNVRVGIVPMSVEKTWKVAAFADIDAQVELTLQRRLLGSENEADWEVDTKKMLEGFIPEVLTKTADFGNLPRYDDSGNEYEYRIAETNILINGDDTQEHTQTNKFEDEKGVIGYKTTFEQFESHQFVIKSTSEPVEGQAGKTRITNRLDNKIDLRIQKEWAGAWEDQEKPEKPEKPEKLYFEILRNDQSFSMPDGKPADNFIISKPDYADVETEGLPQFDDDGMAYVYSIREYYNSDTNEKLVGDTVYKYEDKGGWDDKKENYEIERVMTAINYPPGQGKSVSVKKVWKDGGDSRHRKEVVVGLYEAANFDQEVTRTTLVENDNWTGRLAIPKDREAESFVVREISVDGATVTYEDLQTSQTESKGTVNNGHHDYIVTNTKNDKNGWTIENLRIGTMQVQVDKQWVNGEMAGHPTSVFVLEKNGVKVYESISMGDGRADQGDETSSEAGAVVIKNTVTGEDYIEATGKWINLPKYDENGALYVYKVKETSIGGETVENGAATGVGDNGDRYTSYLNEEYRQGKGTNGQDMLHYSAENTRSEMRSDLQFHKIWRDDNGADLTVRPDIYLVLYEGIKGKEESIVKTSAFIGRTVERSVENPYLYTYTFDSVPRYNGDGEEIFYYIHEVMPVTNSDYQVSYYNTAPDENGVLDESKATESTVTIPELPHQKLILSGGTIVNRRTALADIKGKKLWANMGGIKLEYYPEVTLQLQSALLVDVTQPDAFKNVTDTSGNDVTIVLPNTNNSYDYVIGQLPKYQEESGKRIQYRVVEKDVPNGFGKPTIEGSNLVLKNTYVVDTNYQVNVDKVWETQNFPMGDGEDAYRYPSMTVTLYRYLTSAVNHGDVLKETKEEVTKKEVAFDANGEPIETTINFENLPKHAPNGREYHYEVEEQKISGYASETTGTKTENVAEKTDLKVSLKNTYLEYPPEGDDGIKIRGTKSWNDQNNKYGLRPEYSGDAKENPVKLTLNRQSKGGGPVEAMTDATLCWEVNWSYYFTNQGGTNLIFAKYAPDGTEYTYWVEEKLSGGYENVYSVETANKGLNITNKLNEAQLTITKMWEDSENLYQTRPTELTVGVQRKLLSGSEADWENYVVNGISINCTLKGNGKTWTTSMKLPKFDTSGGEYEYRAVESTIPSGYEKTPEVHGGSNGVYTTNLANNVIQRDVETIFRATKVWGDDGNNDGFRPAKITIWLCAGDGTDPVDQRITSKIITMEAGIDTYTVSWENLPKFDQKGDKRNYYAKEEVTTDWCNDHRYQEPVYSDETETSCTITNNYKVKSVSVSAIKVWEDKPDDWDTRPEEVMVQLWSWKLNSDGSVTKAEKEGEPVALSSANEWTHQFKGLKYAEAGKRIYYAMQEVPVKGYKAPDYKRVGRNYWNSEKEGLKGLSPDIEAGMLDENGQYVDAIKIVNTLDTTSLKVEKTWDDGSNFARVRPTEVEVALYQGIAADQMTLVLDTKAVKLLNEGSEWAATFEALPKYDKEGTTYLYKAVETKLIFADKTSVSREEITTSKKIGGYNITESTVRGTDDKYATTIKNALIRTDNAISVQKVWDDSKNQDGLRPNQINVKLWKDKGTTGEEHSYDKTLKAELWSETWENLPKFQNDGTKECVYRLQELDVPTGYQLTDGDADNTISISAGDNDLINTYTPKTMEVTATKVWKGDKASKEATRPKSGVTFRLKQKIQGESAQTEVMIDGKEAVKTIKPDEDGNWEDSLTVEWTNLPVRSNKLGSDTAAGSSKQITYLIEEDKVPKYDVEISEGVQGSIKAVSNDGDNSKSITITNTLSEKTTATAVKVWEDINNPLNGEIKSVTLQLQQAYKEDGDNRTWSDVTKTIVLERNKMEVGEETLSELPRYDTAEGETDGYEFMYRFVERSMNVVTKTNGETTENTVLVQAVPASDELSGTIGDYTYTTTVSEPDGNGAATTQVTNLWSGRSVYATKVWEDNNNRDGMRPKQITLNLTVEDGSFPDPKSITLDGIADETGEKDPWVAVWNGLPKAHPDGTGITYVVTEVALDEKLEYTTTIQGAEQNKAGSEEDPYIVTNARTSELRSYTINKIWLEDDDWKSDQPEMVKVELWKTADSGQLVKVEDTETLELSASNNWTATWNDLPKYTNPSKESGAQTLIVYYAKEVGVDGYKQELKENQAGGVLTNTLLTTGLTITKVWEDQDDYYQRRPNSIMVLLERKTAGDIHWTSTQRTWEIQRASDSNWNELEITGLPIRNKENKPYEYRAVETKIGDKEVVNSQAMGYRASYEHTPNVLSMSGKTVITNMLVTTELTGTKTWNDQNNRYGLRPSELSVRVFSDGEQMVAQPKINWTKSASEPVWIYQIEGLPKENAVGEEAVYTAKEDTVVNYTGTQQGNDFVNQLDEGTLAVTKTQEGGSKTSFKFKVDLTIGGTEVPYTGDYRVLEGTEDSMAAGTVHTTDADGLITINGGQKFCIDKLPVEAVYQVTEIKKSGYTLKSKEGDMGIIKKDMVAQALFVNRKNSGSGGGGEKPTKPVDPTKPTESTAPTAPIEPTISTEQTSPSSSVTPSIPFDPDNPVIDIPGNPPKVEIHDPEDDIVYEGPGKDINIGGWGPGEYKIFTFDESDIPLGTLTLTIDDKGIPLAFGLPKTGDTSMPFALLAVIMLGALGGIGALIYKRKKEQ